MADTIVHWNSPEVPMRVHEHQNPGLWERELKAAGWTCTQYKLVWTAPNGTQHLGPFGAWRKMRAGLGVRAPACDTGA